MSTNLEARVGALVACLLTIGSRPMREIHDCAIFVGNLKTLSMLDLIDKKVAEERREEELANLHRKIEAVLSRGPKST